MKFRISAVASVAAVAIAATSGVASAQGKVTLNVITAGDTNMVDYIKDFLGPQFEKQNPNVTVKAVGTGPGDLAIDPTTNTLYVSDAGTSTISVFQDRLEGKPKTLPKDQRHPLVGNPLPEFRLPDMVDGRERTSGEWRGKNYILNFFASW